MTKLEQLARKYREAKKWHRRCADARNALHADIVSLPKDHYGNARFREVGALLIAASRDEIAARDTLLRYLQGDEPL